MLKSLLLMAASAFSTLPSFSADTITTTSDVPFTTPQKVSCFPAKKRLELLQTFLKKDKELSMGTLIMDGSLNKLYQKDLNFIRDAVTLSHLKVASTIHRTLDAFDKDIVQEKFQKGMRLLDYLLIADTWSHILMTNGQCKVKEHFNCPNKNTYEQLYIGRLFVPHVSKTGSVSVELINRGWGLWKDDAKTKATHIGWIGIGCDENLSYDFVRDASTDSVKMHDFAHDTLGWGNLGFSNEKRIER